MPPQIKSVTPAIGTKSGGNTITISGLYLSARPQ